MAVAEDHLTDEGPALPGTPSEPGLDKGKLSARKSKIAGLQMLAMMSFLLKQPSEC
jgi:hypothetical protein